MRFAAWMTGLLLPCALWAQGEAPAQPETPPAGAPAEAAAPSPEQIKAAQIADLVKQIDQLYEARHQSGKAEASLAKAKELLALDPKSYDAQWRIARVAFWLGDISADKKGKAKWGKIGWDAGLAGTQLKPDGIEAQFWGAASLGTYATGSGIMKAVWDGLPKQYEKWIRKAMEMNPKYAWGGPPRALGRYYFTLPGIAGGDNKKSIKLLEQSKQISPEALRTRAYLAESFLAEGDKEKAKAELDFCVGADPKNGDYADNLIYQGECKKLQAKL
ncbi:MAG: hypothetical protein JXR83_15875 [Deltaproteobacteria bacterium]|nr:hypothetical protein [Deltaproteobacteria bacterium]